MYVRKQCLAFLNNNIYVSLFFSFLWLQNIIFLLKSFFSFSVSRVCRLWREVSIDPSLWQVVDLSFGYIQTTANTLQWLCANRLSAVTYLNLSGWKVLNDALIQVRSVNNVNYVNLNFS